MSEPLFLLGAGFNVDASPEAGGAAANGYPLVGDLAEICFGLPTPPAGQSIETLFEAALRDGWREPFERLIYALMGADYYTAGSLAEQPTNVYKTFLDQFPSSHFLTFNYDSLIEILLFKLGRWCPLDGYGVPVESNMAFVVDPSAFPRDSKNQVLHLHGSLCVYAADYEVVQRPGETMQWIQQRDVPAFVFDPDMIGHRFFPYEAARPHLVYYHTDERMIAPVPDKAKGLANTFVQASYRSALKLVADSSEVICIGYSFNPYDEVSFRPLIKQAVRVGRRLTIVSPDAKPSTARLRDAFPEIEILTASQGFSAWVRSGFPAGTG